MEEIRSLVSALEGIVAILGSPRGGVSKRELGRVEEAIGAPLHPVVRAFHATCGKDERILRSSGRTGARILEAAELSAGDGVLSLLGDGGLQWAIKLSPAEQAPIVRSPRPSEGPLGPGSFLERASPTGSWRGMVRSLSTCLRELATWQAIATLPWISKGKIRLVSREAKKRIAESLERVGDDAGLRTYVDRPLGALVRYDSLMDEIVVGAHRDVRSAIESRLSAQLVTLVRDGVEVPPGKATRGAKRSAEPPVAPSDASFRAAVRAILVARYGKAPAPEVTSWTRVDKRVGHALPACLVTFHAMVGGDPKFLIQDCRITPPASLGVDDGWLVIARENQGAVRWALAVDELGRPDPHVWQLGGRGKPTRASSSLAAFLVQIAGWQASLEMAAVARADLTSRTVAASLRRLREHIAAPADGAFAIPGARDVLVDPKRRVLASVQYEGDGASVFVGAPDDATLVRVGDQARIELESL